MVFLIVKGEWLVLYQLLTVFGWKQLLGIKGCFRPEVGIGTISGATRCRKMHSQLVAIRYESG